MFKCPVCEQAYRKKVPEVCKACGWNLSLNLLEGEASEILLKTEQTRLTWAKQIWQRWQLLNQHLPDSASNPESDTNLSEILTRLERLEEQNKQAILERESLKTQLDWVLYYFDIMNPQQVANALSRLEAWLEQTVLETPTWSEVGMDYNPLIDVLAAGDWQIADEYTWQIILYLAKREPEKYLKIEDWQNFPCTDLQTIDYLWNYYSQGLFGFSVQQQIWESVAQDYQQFAHQVGWFNRENWKYYEELTFNLKAPMGHLPVIYWRRRACYGVGSETVEEGLFAVFTRIKACHFDFRF